MPKGFTEFIERSPPPTTVKLVMSSSVISFTSTSFIKLSYDINISELVVAFSTV